MDVLSPSLTQAVHEAKAVRADWWERMRVSLGGLREAFRRHVAVTQAPGGVLDAVVAHRHRSADFVFDAYELDIAGGD